jgi:hypothetical protein
LLAKSYVETSLLVGLTIHFIGHAFSYGRGRNPLGLGNRNHLILDMR